MRAGQIRAANRLLDELQVVNGTNCDLLDIGSEGAVFVIGPHPELAKDMSLLEYAQNRERYLISFDGTVSKH